MIKKSLIMTLLIISLIAGCANTDDVTTTVTQEEQTTTTTTQEEQTTTTTTQEEQTTTTDQPEEPNPGYEIVNNNLNMDWHVSIRPFQLFEMSSNYQLASYYDWNNSQFVINSLDGSGNLIETTTVINMDIYKNYGEDGLVYGHRFNDNQYITKMDENGVNWEKVGSFDQYRVHFPTQDGGYITSLLQVDSESSNDYYLIKLDNEGNPLWQLGPYYDVKMLREYEDGSILFLYTYFKSNDFENHILRYDAQMNKVMEIETNGLTPTGLPVVTDDYIYVSTVENGETKIQCYDLNGNLQVEYNYLTQINFKEAHRDVLTYNNNTVYLLEEEIQIEARNSYIKTFDNEGNRETLYGPYQNMKVLQRYEDGSVLLSYGQNDIYYLKIDRNGEIIFNKKMADNTDLYFKNIKLKDQGFMYYYIEEDKKYLGKANGDGETLWEVEVYDDGFELLEGINDDIYIFYYNDMNAKVAHYNQQGELLTTISLEANFESILNFKILGNGMIVYASYDIENIYLVILSPTGDILYKNELKGYIYDNFGDHNTFFTINESGEQEKVILTSDAIAFVNYQYNYSY